MRFRHSILIVAAWTVAAGDPVIERPAAAAPRAFTQESIPATPTVAPGRPATIEAVRFGFDGYMLSDAWSPVRIYLSGNPAINAGAFAGTVTLDFAQDATQSASITASFATTPGRVIPTEIFAAIPQATPSVRVRVHDQFDRLVHEKFFWQAQFGETQLPASLLEEVELVVVVADRSGAEPSIARAVRSPEAVPDLSEPPSATDTPTPTIEERLASCVVRDEELPTSETGYDGVAIVAARSDVLGSLAVSKMAALSSWVRSGGCLVVLAGADPQTWVPHFWDAPPVAILEPASVNPDPDLLSDEHKSTSAALTARVVKLILPIADSGWRVEWGTIRSVRHDGEAHDGLLAQGPAGLGWVVVLGIDPASLGNTSAQLKERWMQALRCALAEASQRPKLDRHERWLARASGPDSSSRLAMKSALDSLAGIPALGDGAFIAIAAFLILLAVAIGPLDALLLRRARLRAWSWATALGWIAFASVLAAIVPPLIRSGASTSHRLRVVDVVQSSGGKALARQTALTSLFANASSGVLIADPSRPNSPPFGWFRGVSASRMDPGSRTAPLTTFATLQTELRVDGVLPERISAPTPSAPLFMGQWTLRSFMSFGAPTESPVVRIERQNGSWTVAIRGLKGSRAEGSLRIGSDRMNLESRPISAGSPEIEFPAVRGTGENWERQRIGPVSEHTSEFGSRVTPAQMGELPGARERLRVIEALVASGGWACVSILETGNPSSLDARAAGSDSTFTATESTLWRVLIPLETGDRQRPMPLAAARMPASPARKAPP